MNIVEQKEKLRHEYGKMAKKLKSCRETAVNPETHAVHVLFGELLVLYRALDDERAKIHARALALTPEGAEWLHD